MAGAAQIPGELAYDLYPHEPLEQGGGARPGLARLQQEQIIAIKFEAVSVDSTTVKVPSRRHWGFKKTGPQAIGRSRGGCTTKIHLVAAHARCALNFSLSPGQAGGCAAGAGELVTRLVDQPRLVAI